MKQNYCHEHLCYPSKNPSWSSAGNPLETLRARDLGGLVRLFLLPTIEGRILRIAGLFLVLICGLGFGIYLLCPIHTNQLHHYTLRIELMGKDSGFFVVENGGCLSTTMVKE